MLTTGYLPRMSPHRFLFTTLGHVESTFYGLVGEELRRRGHAVAHVTYSRRAARVLERAGFRTYCLSDLMARDKIADLAFERSRIVSVYGLDEIEELSRTDFVCRGRRADWIHRRTALHVRALERVMDDFRPDVVVPEVGNETMRIAAHRIALEREVPVLMLFYTIFPQPLRLYVDRMTGPLVERSELKPLTPVEEERTAGFVAEFIRRDTPIREYRHAGPTAYRLRMLARHLSVKLVWDRRNPYLRPLGLVLEQIAERRRRRRARRLYGEVPDGPFFYFPLHVADDYKLKRLLPHLADQLEVVRAVAAALPPGHRLVVKEHPMSIGRNPVEMLRAVRDMPAVSLVEPHTSSHRLIDEAAGVVVISSTVGLEAILHGTPVVTLGQPFYAGLGLTRDLDGTAGLTSALAKLPGEEVDRTRTAQFLCAAMARCLPGAPVLVDRSPENAVLVADSLESVGVKEALRRRDSPVPDRGKSSA